MVEVSFVPPPKWTEISKDPPARTGALPKKVATSQVKKQKSRDKKAPNAYEALLQQPPLRIHMPFGYVNLEGCLIEDPRIGDVTDAELFIQNQMEKIACSIQQHTPSTILVHELSQTITLTENANEYARIMANHLLAFIHTIELLHHHTSNLHAVPKLVSLFPSIHQFLKEPPPLPVPKTNYEVARNRIIGVGRMLQHCGSRANPKSPPHEIHEVCYTFICRLKTYYPEISVKDIHADAEEPQIDKYMDAKTKSEYEQSFRPQWKPKLKHETAPEPIQKGFGSKPPWAKKKATSTDGPPSPPPVPPVPSESTMKAKVMSAAHLRGLGRGTGRAYPTLSNLPTMPHPAGTRPGPQPDDYSKGIPDIGIAFINAEPKPSKTHPCLVYGEQDGQRVTRPYTSPHMHSSVMWKPDDTLTIEELQQRCPHHHQHLLRRLCCDAESSCLTMSNSDVPLWYNEVQYLQNPHHPLQNEKVPPIFLTRFLQHSLRVPKLLYEARAPFIAPLIPLEFSRDAFLP